jgi:hypothetical protein
MNYASPPIVPFVGSRTARKLVQLTEARDVVISDLEALLDSTVPLPALAEQMIRSSVDRLKEA